MMEESRQKRFNEGADSLADNRFLELKRVREDARKANANGPSLAPRDLSNAVNLVGTCQDMCPLYEREEREYQNNVDKLEFIPGSRRIDPSRAVKAYHRPAAGNEQPPPEDIRPPDVLKRTLDYLFGEILAGDPDLLQVHPFLRDRTRAIRQDFTIQNVRSLVAITCNERVARFHIYCLHKLCGRDNFSQSQELEQLRKVLQTLQQFYDDARHASPPITCPNEAEFRAYYILTHLRDPEAMRQAELLAFHVFSDPLLQLSLRLQSLVQRNNINTAPGSRARPPANSEACLNSYSRFFKLIETQAPYLLACLVETDFYDLRRGAFKAMRKAYMEQHANLPVLNLVKLLGFDDAQDCARCCRSFGITVETNSKDQPTEIGVHRATQFDEFPNVALAMRPSQRLVESKRGSQSVIDIVNGRNVALVIQAPRLSPRTESRLSAPALSRVPSFEAIQAIPSRSSPPRSEMPPKRKALSPVTSFPVIRPERELPTRLSPKIASVSAFSVAPQSPIPAFAEKPKNRSPRTAPLQHPISDDKNAKLSPRSATKSARIAAVAHGMAESILKDIIQDTAFKAASTAISSRNAQLANFAHEQEQTLIFKAASNLADQMIDDVTRNVVHEKLCERRIKHRSFYQWRDALARSIQNKRSRAIQLREFRAAAHSIGRASSRQQSDTSDLTLARLDLNTDAIADNVLAKNFESAADTVHHLWQRSTFTSLLQRHLERLLPDFPTTSDPFRVLVTVDHLISAQAMWYRAKFGFKAISDVEIVIKVGEVSVEVRMLDPSSLLSTDYKDVGLCLMDLADYTANSDDSIRQRCSLILSRLKLTSRYKPAFMLVTWPEEHVQNLNLPNFGIPIETSVATLAVSPTVDADFQHALQQIMPRIVANVARCRPVNVNDLLQPLIEIWQNRLLELSATAAWHLDFRHFLQSAADILVKTLMLCTKAMGANPLSLKPLTVSANQSFGATVIAFVQNNMRACTAETLSRTYSLAAQLAQNQATVANLLCDALRDIIAHDADQRAVVVSAALDARLQNIYNDLDCDMRDLQEPVALVKKRRPTKKKLGKKRRFSDEAMDPPAKKPTASVEWQPSWVTALSQVTQEARALLKA